MKRIGVLAIAGMVLVAMPVLAQTVEVAPISAQDGPFPPLFVFQAPTAGVPAPIALTQIQPPGTFPMPAPIQSGQKTKVALAVPDSGLSYLSGLGGQWWRTPYYVSMLNLAPDQQRKMDEVFQDARIKLIGLDAELQKAEVTLEPLMEAERLDESRIVAQIDRVAAARAELEKANSRMLLGIRQVLTQDQWVQLRDIRKNSLKLQIKPDLLNKARTPR